MSKEYFYKKSLITKSARKEQGDLNKAWVNNCCNINKC